MADISALPDSVIVFILSFLRYPRLISCSRVSKRWYRLCYDISLWRKLWFSSSHSGKVTGSLVRRLVPRTNSYILSIDLEGCTSIDNEAVKYLSMFCPNVRKLSIKDCRLVSDRGCIALAQNSFKLTSLKLPMENITSKGLVAVVKNNQLLKRIYAYSRAVTQATLNCIAGNCADLETLIVYESCLDEDESGSIDALTDKMLITLADGCRKLKELTLRYNQVLLSDLSLVYAASKCRQIQQFVVDYCDRDHEITDIGVTALARFCDIRCLHLSNGQISDNALLVIAEYIPNIEDLSLEFSQVSDVGIFKLMQSCRKLESLVVHNSDNHERGITDASAFMIGHYACEDFRLLGIAFADITDKGLKYICENTELSSLSVSGCGKLSYAGLKSCFEDLGCIMSLDISFTEIVETDNQLLEMGQALPWLDSLDVTDCIGISREGISNFKARFPFCKVAV
ncbi:predicted protein [Nematostella vectensis]|uniref:F-box domain-containing protein n=1 Tax=Nematostella vectensis TaxID=45351 RepID=A7S506_NEMVE|nr:F-box/LRR-repeat protein 7 [Nematostella vectensis]EDO41249.1 predicted protein [Nematostella vectensis]|eukprot:XP_001633312.1 predicted protein [Nematostella vectensis]